MALKPNINDREKDKFLQTTSDETAVRTSLVDPDGKPISINDDGQMHVVLRGMVCDSCSTSTPLAAGASFTGLSNDVLDYGIIFVSVKSGQASATDGLSLQQSMDGTNWDITDEYTVAANAGKTFAFQPACKYFRVTYTNGAVDQTYFRLQTTFKKTNSLDSSHRISDAIVNDDDARLVKSVVTGEDVVTSDFVNVGTKSGMFGNNMLVSVDQVERSTNSLKVIDYSHAELHGGDHFVSRGYETLAKNGTRDFLIITPNTTKWAHFVPQMKSSTAPIVASLYEDATVSANGTLDGTINRNRNSTNANTTIVYYTPTVTTTGTLISSTYIGSGKGDSGAERDNEEIILKQNTLYLLRVVEQNVSSTVISWSFDWYEHTNLI